MRKHDEYSYICHLCDFKTHRVRKFDEHSLAEHGISKYKGELACHKCEYRGNDRAHMNKHILRKHGEYTNPCHICDFKTHQPTKLSKHLLQEHGISKFSGDFACHICDFKTDQKSTISLHTTNTQYTRKTQTPSWPKMPKKSL